MNQGEVPEWLNGALSKSVGPFGSREFESLPLRFYFSEQDLLDKNHRACFIFSHVEKKLETKVFNWLDMNGERIQQSEKGTVGFIFMI